MRVEIDWDRPVKELAAEYRVTTQTIYRWRRRAGVFGHLPPTAGMSEIERQLLLSRPLKEVAKHFDVAISTAWHWKNKAVALDAEKDIAGHQ